MAGECPLPFVDAHALPDCSHPDTGHERKTSSAPEPNLMRIVVAIVPERDGHRFLPAYNCARNALHAAKSPICFKKSRRLIKVNPFRFSV